MDFLMTKIFQLNQSTRVLVQRLRTTKTGASSSRTPHLSTNVAMKNLSFVKNCFQADLSFFLYSKIVAIMRNFFFPIKKFVSKGYILLLKKIVLKSSFVDSRGTSILSSRNFDYMEDIRWHCRK